jgi:hypothetical protein
MARAGDTVADVPPEHLTSEPRYVIFAAAYRSDALAIDGLRVLSAAPAAEVAGPGLLRRDRQGRIALQKASGSSVVRTGAVGLLVGLAAGLGTTLMWVTAVIGAVAGALVGHHDRRSEGRELTRLVGELVPMGGCAVVAVTERGLAGRLAQQFDLAVATRAIPVAGGRLAVLARRLASGNREVTSALDAPRRADPGG